MSNSNFFKVLFNEGEQTCFADSIKATQVQPINADADCFNWFCLNPLDHTQDTNPTQDWHRTDRPRRADCNVTAFRSILVEMDKLPLDEQLSLIRRLGMPYSTCVYSGGKSYHFVITLSEACESLQDYKLLAKRVYRALGGKEFIDMANGNPSRLTRYPNVYRSDKDRMQSLIEVRSRVSRVELEAWLEAYGVDEPVPTPIVQRKLITLGGTDGLPEFVVKGNPSAYTKLFLANGASDGEWNVSLFKASCDLVRCGYDDDEIIEMLSQVTGYLDSKDVSTVHSAIRDQRSKLATG